MNELIGNALFSFIGEIFFYCTQCEQPRKMVLTIVQSYS